MKTIFEKIFTRISRINANSIQVFVCISLFSTLAVATVRAEATTNCVRHSCCAAMENATVELSDKSLYQLDAKWTNDHNQAMQLSALKGRPQIVTMFFANCQFACPLLVYKMKQIEAALPETVRTNIGFTLVSFDTERDTPAVLHTYRTQRELASNWTLLHGSNSDVLDLAALLGVKFKKDAQGQFAHSNVITILNADGEIAFQESGLDLDVKDIVKQVERLTKR
jgi:protein SCO1/2